MSFWIKLLVNNTVINLCATKGGYLMTRFRSTTKGGCLIARSFNMGNLCETRDANDFLESTVKVNDSSQDTVMTFNFLNYEFFNFTRSLRSLNLPRFYHLTVIQIAAVS